MSFLHTVLEVVIILLVIGIVIMGAYKVFGPDEIQLPPEKQAVLDQVESQHPEIEEGYYGDQVGLLVEDTNPEAITLETADGQIVELTRGEWE